MKEAIIQYNDDPDADGNHMVISWKEIVRCKDCIHCERDCFPMHLNWCTLHEFGRDDEYYCADGERKDSE